MFCVNILEKTLFQINMSSRYRHQSPDNASVARNSKEQLVSFGAPIMAVAIIGLTFYVIFYSSLFEISNIEVYGNTYVDAGLIEAGINKQKEEVRFWILPQHNILAFDEVSAKHQLAHPRINELTINRSLPNTLRISLIEKNSVAEWEWQGRWFEIDDQCIIIGEVGGPTADGLRLRNSKSIDMPSLGTVVCDGDTLNFVKTIDANIPQGHGLEIESFDMANASEYFIDAKTNEGWVVRVGTQTTVAEQMQKLDMFLVSKENNDSDWRKQLTYIDLRFGNSRIYYR